MGLVAETIADSLESKATNSAKSNSKQKKRGKSKSWERSTSRSRQELAEVVEDLGSEDDESEEEDIPWPLAGVPELEIALGKFRRRRDARRLVFEKRRRAFEKFAKELKDLDNEVFDLEETCISLEIRRNARLGIPVPSRSRSQEQPDNRCYLCKRARTGEENGCTENEVVILDPVDPAVVVSRVRPESIVLAAESTPAQYWEISEAQKTVVDHNRKP